MSLEHPSAIARLAQVFSVPSNRTCAGLHTFPDQVFPRETLGLRLRPLSSRVFSRLFALGYRTTLCRTSSHHPTFEVYFGRQPGDRATPMTARWAGGSSIQPRPPPNFFHRRCDWLQSQWGHATCYGPSSLRLPCTPRRRKRPKDPRDWTEVACSHRHLASGEYPLKSEQGRPEGAAP